jgi:hypothetical protein
MVDETNKLQADSMLFDLGFGLAATSIVLGVTCLSCGSLLGIIAAAASFTALIAVAAAIVSGLKPEIKPLEDSKKATPEKEDKSAQPDKTNKLQADSMLFDLGFLLAATSIVLGVTCLPGGSLLGIIATAASFTALIAVAAAIVSGLKPEIKPLEDSQTVTDKSVETNQIQR